MTSKYWIKLYIEILDDAKMGTMTDRQFRRTMQLFLLAGELNGSGELPPVSDMAWRLRMGAEELETDLADLASAGIVHKVDGLWIVTKFEDRQRASTGTERWQRWQERQRKKNYYQTQDKRKANDTLSDTESDIDIDTDKRGHDSRIFSIYEQEIGLLTPMIAEQIKDWVENYPEGWLEDAIKIAAENNKRKISYINGILKNWRTDGRDGEKKTLEKDLEKAGYVRR